MHAYNQTEILEAWKTFVARGIIPEDKVRLMVARSWQRCRNYGLDPWSYSYPKCSDSLLQKKRTKYAEWLALANPILNYVFTLLDHNVSMCDSEGFIFELITPLNNYPRTVGTYITEAACGNGAVTITLNERVPFRMDGYEHYRICSQTYSGVSAPIILDHNNLAGVLSATSPFGALPNKSLPMIIAAAKIIDHLLMEKQAMADSFENSILFKEMINCSSQLVVTLDCNGKVIAANQALELLFGIDRLEHKSFGNFLVGKSDLSILMDNASQPSENAVFKLKGRAGGEQTSLETQLVRKHQIRLLNGDIRTILVFNHDSAKDSVVTQTRYTVPPLQFKQNNSSEVDFVGESTAWSKVRDMIQKTARFPSNVLLEGETGTGKELAARAIHRLSNRRGHFVAINCGSIPKDLLQSELFGYEEGAFTGARAQGSIGKFEYAHEGTLLLDEIAEMPLDMQVTLLRFLQERTVTRINSNTSKSIDVRIIAATNRNMAELVRIGQFRQDLYYRLNVIEITLPPLRERKTDIPLLCDLFISELSKQFNLHPKLVSEDVISILCQNDWPGNVRELKNVIEKALILSDGRVISPADLPSHILHGDHISPEARIVSSDNLDLEREHIISLLEQNGGNIFRTAKALNMARNTLYKKIEKLNIKLKVSALENKK